jgi:hypothetical protein
VLNVGTGDARYNGVYTVMDTGPKVQGRLLDLYMWSCHEALRFGRRQVQVTVLRLGWDPKASAPSLVDRLFRGREGEAAHPWSRRAAACRRSSCGERNRRSGGDNVRAHGNGRGLGDIGSRQHRALATSSFLPNVQR